MIAMLIAALIGQPASPSPAALPVATFPSAAAAAMPDAPSPVATPFSPALGLRRRMPLIVPSPSPLDAVIRNSGSTNTSGYAVVVHPDFSVDVYDADGTRHATIPAAQGKLLFAKLDAARPLDALPIAHCMKSASFGTRTTIAFAGQTTADISCGGNDAARELFQTASAIVQKLGVKTRGGFGLRRSLL